MINRKRILTVLFCLFILVCSVLSFAACGGGDDGKQITSISVSYTQGDKVVYTNTSLDELKSSVVVTLQYSDGTTETITDYVLSGTLTEGESVVTVSYKGFEKTFTVNVSEIIDDSHTHTFVKHEAKAATCTEDGNIEYWSCPICNKYYADDNSFKEIALSDTVIPAEHTGGTEIRDAKAPTESKEGYTGDTYCLGCGEKIATGEILDKLDHTHAMSKVEAKDATCTEPGNIEYWHCEICGKNFSDPEGIYEVEDVTIEAVGHTYSPEWSQDENYHWHAATCGHTDEIKDKSEHTFDDDNQCTLCGYVKTEASSDSYFHFTLLEDGTYEIRAKNPNNIPQNISIPSSYNGKPVTSIGDLAFFNCSSLTCITIPDSVTRIGSSAFRECYKLVEVYNLSSLDITKGSTDNGCVGYFALIIHTSASEPSNLFTDEKGYIFYEDGDICYLMGYTCNDTELNLPANCNGKNYGINQYAFSECNGILSVTIPDSVTSIGKDAFNYCSSLTSVTFGDNSQLTSIGKDAFSGCSSLTSITIPDGVTSIGDMAFWLCYKLIEVYNLSSLDITKGSGDNGCVGLYALVVHASVDETSNVFTDENGYIFYEDGEICYLVGYTGNDTELTLPANCNGKNYGIYRYAFYNCSSLTSVTFGVGSQLTSIGENAFSGCTGLTSITIPDSVTSIGEGAFWLCYKLVEVYNLSSLNITKDSWDNGCVGLYALIVHTSKDEASNLFTDENGYIFYEDGEICYLAGYTGNDTELTLPANCNGKNYGIYRYAFYNCSSLTSVTFGVGSQLTSIGNHAFNYCRSLTSVTFGDNSQLTIIGGGAFGYCSSLTSITIPDSVTSIGSYAFRNCSSLTSITLPDSVTSIGSYAFSDTAYYNNDENWNNGVLYIGKHLIKVESSVSGSYEIAPETLTIAGSAFYGCESLTGISIPDSLTSIGKYAFEECRNLRNVEFGEDSQLTSIGYGAFAYCETLESITVPDSVTSIGNYAFYECSSLTSITIPDGVTSIGSGAFRNCSSLTSITIPDGVTNIGSYAFRNCSSLTSITIPDGVTNIGSYAFRNCSSLTSITIPERVTSIGDSAFYGCYKLVEIYNLSSLNITKGSNGNGYVGYYALVIHTSADEASNVFTDDNGYIFYEDGDICYLVGYTGNDTELTLPANCNGKNYGINKYAFYSCNSLTSITIPDSVTSIGEMAFYGCGSLTNVIFGDNSQLTSIGEMAFYGCGSLTNVIFGDNSQLTSIGEMAFYGCGSFTNVIFGDNSQLTSIGDYAFYNCSSLTSITIPDGVTSIGSYAFYNCSSLTSITIPDSVTSIGYMAFYGCSSLTSVTFENPNGWWYSDSSKATSGTSISSSNLANPSTAATYLTSTYCNRYWKRS